MPTAYITGTDTEIGKTFVTCALLRDARASAQRIIGMKPVASGCIETVEGWRSEDALAHIEADGLDAAYIDRNPYALPLPVAPEIAAQDAGVAIDLSNITQAYARLRAAHEGVLVEGVGGWLAPLTETLEQADVVRALQLPVLMVVGMRLGCVHQARATQRAIAAGQEIYDRTVKTNEAIAQIAKGEIEQVAAKAQAEAEKVVKTTAKKARR